MRVRHSASFLRYFVDAHTRHVLHKTLGSLRNIFARPEQAIFNQAFRDHSFGFEGQPFAKFAYSKYYGRSIMRRMSFSFSVQIQKFSVLVLTWFHDVPEYLGNYLIKAKILGWLKFKLHVTRDGRTEPYGEFA